MRYKRIEYCCQSVRFFCDWRYAIRDPRSAIRELALNSASSSIVPANSGSYRQRVEFPERGERAGGGIIFSQREIVQSRSVPCAKMVRFQPRRHFAICQRPDIILDQIIQRRRGGSTPPQNWENRESSHSEPSLPYHNRRFRLPVPRAASAIPLHRPPRQNKSATAARSHVHVPAHSDCAAAGTIPLVRHSCSHSARAPTPCYLSNSIIAAQPFCNNHSHRTFLSFQGLVSHVRKSKCARSCRTQRDHTHRSI